MITVESRVNIDRRPDEVFAFLAEPANWSQWLDGIVESRRAGAGGLKPGVQVTLVIKFLGRRFETLAEVQGYEPDSLLSMKAVSGPFPMNWAHSVVAAGAGCDLTTRLEAEPGRFFRLAGPLLTPVLQRHFDDDHSTLKELLERAHMSSPYRKL